MKVDDDEHEQESIAQNRDKSREVKLKIYFCPTSPSGFSHFVRRFRHHSVVIRVAVVKFEVHLKGTTVLSSKIWKDSDSKSFQTPI